MNHPQPSVVTIDVRDMLASGQEPLPHILRTAASLKSHESLRIIAPFEPVPLYQRMIAMGFQHQTQRIADGPEPAWEVVFTRYIPQPSISSNGLRQLDVRNLPGATAANAINSALESLAYDDVLVVKHSSDLPVHPDPAKYQSKSQPAPKDQSIATRIWRRV